LVAALRALPAMWILVAVTFAAGAAATHYWNGLTPVALTIDGEWQSLRTHCDSVGALLQDLEVDVAPWDRVEPAPDTPLYPGVQVRVQHAHPVTLVADGQTRTLHTQHYGVDQILDQAQLDVKEGDELWVNGQRVSTSSWPAPAAPVVSEASLDRAVPSSRTAQRSLVSIPASHIEIRRANVVHLDDDGVGQTLRTTARTLGQALSEAQILIYLGDRVVPDLNTPIQTGMRVHIARAVPVSVQVDGRTLHTRTQQETVAGVLAEMSVQLVGQDFCVPPIQERIKLGLQIQITRVSQELAVEQTEIPFETEWFADASLPIDQRRVEASGASGIRRRRYRIVYHDQREVERYLEDDWIAREPQSRKIAYGTKITVRTLDTPEGEIEYWRRMPVFLTSYTADTCGKTPDHPWYGMTRLGWKMRHGIIAVDPTVIPLLSRLYVPGYGSGIAADTGSLIIGRHIDLGHQVDNFTMYFEWGYVYLLTPVPPPSQIRWILPDFPRGRYP
jgi:uncharacterized protein YabE (DUF348 family)